MSYYLVIEDVPVDNTTFTPPEIEYVGEIPEYRDWPMLVFIFVLGVSWIGGMLVARSKDSEDHQQMLNTEELDQDHP